MGTSPSRERMEGIHRQMMLIVLDDVASFLTSYLACIRDSELQLHLKIGALASCPHSVTLLQHSPAVSFLLHRSRKHGCSRYGQLTNLAVQLEVRRPMIRPSLFARSNGRILPAACLRNHCSLEIRDQSGYSRPRHALHLPRVRPTVLSGYILPQVRGTAKCWSVPDCCTLPVMIPPTTMAATRSAPGKKTNVT